MPNSPATLDSAVTRMVEEAHSLYARFGHELQSDAEISSLLRTYSSAIEHSGQRMRETGVVEACTDCATKGPGSCCFPGIEDGYDVVLYLVNLLLGCLVPRSRMVQDSCFFVGPQGCRLKARYYFCLHYLCPRLLDLLGPDAAHRLLVTIGQELSVGFELEQAIRRWLSLHEPVST